MKITIKEYEDAILNASLSEKQMDILKTLYKFPDSTASQKELSEALNRPERGFALQIGNIGSKIANYLNKKPNNYISSGVERPAYFMVVGPYYSLEGKGRSDRPGWEMNDNLIKALENLKLV